MRKVAVEDIEAEMILARDVSSTSGNVLLGKGTTLSPALGRRLKNWGIFFVYVEGEEISAVKEEVVEISAEDVKKSLEEKFEGVLDDPLMQKLFNAVFNFKLKGKPG